jgi:hypothetical protein
LDTEIGTGVLTHALMIFHPLTRKSPCEVFGTHTGDSGVVRMSIATNATAIAVNRNQRSMIPFNIGILYTYLSFVSV